MKIKVSIVVPIYNTEKYLRECLDSVANQTLHDIECICIDDGSEDTSRQIAKEYTKKDARFKVFCQSNRGQSAARNAGLDKAQGEYVYFLDSDDSISPKAMEILYARAVEDDLDILMFDGVTVYDEKYLRDAYPYYENAYQRSGNYVGVCTGQEMYVRMVNKKDYIVQVCLQFTKRDYIENQNLRFFEGIVYEDNIYTFKSLISAQRVAHLKEQLFIRRLRENSTMTNRNMTFYHFISIFTCYVEGLRYVMTVEDDELEQAMSKRLMCLYQETKKKYAAITSRNMRYADSEKLEELAPLKKVLLWQLGFEFHETYLFPYAEVEKNSKLILYGAGNIGCYYYNQIKCSGYCELALWVDKNYEKIVKERKQPICSPENIKNTSFDSILIAVEDEETAAGIRKFLIKQGVSNERIIWEKPRYVIF